MKKLFERLAIPKALQGASSARVEFSFMERGAFKTQFSTNGFASDRLISVAEELGAEEDRARMM